MEYKIPKNIGKNQQPSKFIGVNPNQPAFEQVNKNFLSDVNIPVSSSVTLVPTRDIISNSFITVEDTAIIPNSDITSSFLPGKNLIEFYVYDTQKNIISRNYNFQNWSITQNTSNTEVPTTFTNDQGIQVLQSDTGSIPTDFIELNPSIDLYNLGFDVGETYAVYNFINYELGSSIDDTYYISEISGDRTEIRLRSNTIPNGNIRGTYEKFRRQFNSQNYFDEFYLGLFDNKYEICTNIIIESDNKGESLLIKLYNELDPSVLTESQVYLITKVGETVSYKVEFEEDFQSFIDNATYIKGPNINIPLQDLVNNSTTLQSENTLLNSNSSGSINRVLNILNQTGVTITPDYSYSTFNQFINFSSAKERLNNFVEKVTEIQSYESDITTIENVTGSNPGVVSISSSLASLTTKISNLVENFDGYENYLYYNSSSYAYPKTGSAYPYTLLPTTNQEVVEWVGSDVEGSQYYGGYILSASLYDENNQNWLYYTIPDFIKENSSNDEYITFSNMVGQSFDEVWLYTKALSERYNTTNDPDKGLPLDLAADAIKGLGFETFGNNYDNQDNFIGLAGEDNGTYVPPTGSELITKYVAINNGQIINYWNVGYSWEDYVEQFVEVGFPYAIDKVSKEIYKRLYHNMAYLTKKKGSISGLRQLINIWGIPNTILRINEFGGKNRDNTDDYDLWQNKYSYAYTPISTNNYMASSSVKMPWMPLERNYIAETENIVPDGIALRFKAPKGAPTSTFGGSFYSQSLAVKKSNGTSDSQMDWGISLFYEDQPTGSYSGSSFSDYYNYGKLRFYMSASSADGGVQVSNDIFLPFFDGGWWSVLLQRDQHVEYTDNATPTTYTLFAANKQSNGWDGSSIGFTGSVSMDSTTKLSINKSWNDFGITNVDGVYVGGYISGSNIMSEVSNEFGKIFSGSFQEFRYYSNDIPDTVFNDFVMNPESIEGNNITGSESSFDIVNFRAPLGNELEHIFSGSRATFTKQIPSSHPAITGSAAVVITGSFRNPIDSTITSSYNFIGYNDSKDKIYSKPNTEVYFLDQPSIGIRNRVSKKIKVEDGSVYGKVLSQYKSIDQDYLISQSYTEDITSLEVGFSPQDEVNDDIIASFGYGVISSVIADPRFFYDSQEVYYPKLRQISEEYFKKYTEGNVWDYLRLIKYFDNSLFKAIKSYVPARTSVTTGVIIKQNMLERNRRPSVLINPNTTIAYTPETGSVVGGQSTETGMNSAISYRDLELTGSINIGTLSGLHGNVPPNLRGEVSASGAGFNIIPITQSWEGNHNTVTGLIPFTESSSYEFYNGEYSGSTITVTTQSLLNNPIARSPILDTSYTINITSSDGKYSDDLESPINTYPSFSLSLKAYSYPPPDPALKNSFETDFNNFGSDPSIGKGTGSIFIIQSTPSTDINWKSKWWVLGLILPQEMDLGINPTSPTLTSEPGNHLGITYTGVIAEAQDDVFFNLTPTLNIPLPSTSGSGLTSLENESYIPNNLGPYFKLDITGSMNTFYADGNDPSFPSGVGFSLDGGFGDLDSNQLISTVLGPNTIITKTIGKSGNTNGEGLIKYQINEPESNSGRPIQLYDKATTGPANITWDDNEPVFEGVSTSSVFISNYDSFIKRQNLSLYPPITPSSPTRPLNSLPQIGSGSLSLIGTTWTGSWSDYGTWSPTLLVLNKRNYSTSTGEIINNSETLTQSPQFQFNIDAYEGTPSSVPVIFNQSNYDIIGLQTYNSGTLALPYENDSIGYSYLPSSNNYLSGSSNTFGFINSMFMPTSTSLQYLPFFPQLPLESSFYNTPFNPLINNATESVKNTFLQVVEYNNGPIPSNFNPIVNETALKARVPDSFYTQQANIIPRYIGSTLQSANYNHYTPPSLTWGGDVSYGDQAVIDKYPIYFAHFKSSYNNLNLEGTYTYEIDALILSPNENVTGEKAPLTPITIKVDGSGLNLTEVRSTFEVGRNVNVAYDSLIFNDINYGNLKIGENKIYQGSLEMDTLIATTLGPTGNGDNNFPNFTDKIIFQTSSFTTEYKQEGAGGDIGEVNNTNFPFLYTSSNSFLLAGSPIEFISPLYDGHYYKLIGPGLAILNSMNTAVSRSLVAEYTTGSYTVSPGIPTELTSSQNIGLDSNNFIEDFISSSVGGFKEEEGGLPFIIKPNDEIVITYNTSGLNFLEKTFTVTSIVSALDDPDLPTGYNNGFGVKYCADFDCTPTTAATWNSNNDFLRNRINVYPDPTLNNIIGGEVNSFIIRRRVNADDRVIIYQSAPSTFGINETTGSGGGYLIPEDFSPTQRRNTLTLINQLKAKNAFRDDSLL